jgi:large subunit ribosomal protein L20
MSRVKRGVRSNKKRKNLLKDAKGYKWGRKNKYRLAKEALAHAWTYAFRDRKAKKRTFRQLWNVKINASCRMLGTNYSQFINGLKKKNIQLNRKVLADLAENKPEIFEKIVKETK